MNRRHFVSAAALAASSQLSDSAHAAEAPGSIFELRYFKLRNTAQNQASRTSDFLGKFVLPAAQRAGAGPMGFFSCSVGQDSPWFLSLMSFPSLAALEAAKAKLAADPYFAAQQGAYNSAPGLGYERMENSLLRAFDGMPAIDIPPVEAGQPPRVFELRCYESNNTNTLQRKIKMFNDAEIGIFKRLGMRPVFFGETIVGRNLPNLVYMLSFDDLAAREKLWRAFVNDPEWHELSAKPGLSNAEIVSNISNWLLSPLPFSPIR